MYLSGVRPRKGTGGVDAAGVVAPAGTDSTGGPAGVSSGARAGRIITGNVIALGTVSLVTDVSSEMITAVLPAYLVLGLHLSMIQYGVVDGFYIGATALTRLVGGYLADRLRWRKAVAGFGYGLSAVAKLGLLFAGPWAVGIVGALGADRIGKGLRTAPRDALITLSTPVHGLGRAFGVHRTMDSVGAFLGPLAALAVLAGAGQAYDAVFVVSFCVAVAGVLLLVLFVRDRREPVRAAAGVSLRAGVGLLRRPGFRMVQLAAVLLGLATVGDGFVYLMLQRSEGLPVIWFPLLAVGTNLGYLLLALPLGWLADRVGRWPVVLGGYGALLAVYLLLAAGVGGWASLLAVVLLYGAFYAGTDGVLIAYAGPMLPASLRTTGIALLQTGQAVAYLVSSIGFGVAWQWWGPARASGIAAVGVLLVLPLSALLLRGAARSAGASAPGPAVPDGGGGATATRGRGMKLLRRDRRTRE